MNNENRPENIGRAADRKHHKRKLDPEGNLTDHEDRPSKHKKSKQSRHKAPEDVIEELDTTSSYTKKKKKKKDKTKDSELLYSNS